MNNKDNNLPPGVTTGMLEERFGGDDEEHTVVTEEDMVADQRRLYPDEPLIGDVPDDREEEPIVKCKKGEHDWAYEESWPGDRVKFCRKCCELYSPELD